MATSKQNIAIKIIKSFILIYLIEQSNFPNDQHQHPHDKHHTQQQHHHHHKRREAQKPIRSVLALSNNYHEQSPESREVTQRIDRLLHLRSVHELGNNNDYINNNNNININNNDINSYDDHHDSHLWETPLEYIKQIDRSKSVDGDEATAAGAKSSHKSRLSTNKSRHRQRHALDSPSSSSSSSAAAAAAAAAASNTHSAWSHRHYHRKRAKRNNLARGYLDAAADRPVVATSKGLVRGVTQKIFTNKFVDAFLGIPFAQPPVGAFRFRHPRPKNPWPGELDASHYSNSCYQVNDTFFGSTFMGTSIWNANTPLDEDCLYLNIWTPFGAANTTIPSSLGQRSHHTYDTSRTTSNSMPSGNNNNNNNNNNYKAAKKAVLVWIFGGGFYSGTSTLKIYEGGALASEEDIIVVSMNYRVSSLGFLYFGRPDAPGNAGMFDQLLALQWINDNIDQFGGDPAKVTIFGESAGAVSVAFHLLSPLSRNLFSQAILQSGAATCPWGSMGTDEIIANGLQLASLLNCPSNQSDLDAVMKCLVKADPMALVSQEVGQTKSVLNFPFVPVVDGSFLLESPAESLANSNFKSARILLGSNNDEANSFLIYLPEFSNCPASGANSNTPTSNSDQPSQLASSANEMLLMKKSPAATSSSSSSSSSSTNNEEQERPIADDHEAASGEIESIEMLPTKTERHILNQYHQPEINQHVSPNEDNNYNNITSYQQPVTGALSSTKSTNQKQQHQANAQNIDISKPCKPNEYPTLTRDDFLTMLREDLNPYAGHPIGKKAIVFEYSNWNNPMDTSSQYDAIDKIVGDYYFTCHVNAFAQHYAEAGNAVFMYYFKHRSSMSPWPKWMGVLHADEINFVFGEPLNPAYNYTHKEVDLSRRIMKYWANFARYGNPTSEGDNSSIPAKWPEYKDKRQYFELNSDYIRIGRGPRARQCAFWSQYLPQMIRFYDKNHKCHLPSDELASLTQPLYPHTPGQLGLGNYAKARRQYDFMPFSSTPFTVLFIFISIMIVIGLVGFYIIYSRGANWMSDLWSGLSFNGGRRTGDEEDDETESGHTATRNGQSRAG